MDWWQRPSNLMVAAWTVIALLIFGAFVSCAAWAPVETPLLDKPIRIGSGTKLVIETPFRLGATSCESFLFVNGQKEVHRAQKQETADKVLSCSTPGYSLKTEDELLTAGDWTLYADGYVNILARDGAPALLKLVKAQGDSIMGSVLVFIIMLMVWFIVFLCIAAILQELHIP